MNKLQQSIDQLRRELEQSEPLDDAARAELLQALAEIEQSLIGPDAVPLAEQQPLIDQFKETIWRFERSHPTLTMIVGQVMDDLSRMGI
jgi:hypothetical protein